MLPKVSILIPTLNAGSVIRPCLESIGRQNYPKELVEIILGDGGSTDDTIEVAQKYGARTVNNPLKTGESGKMAALRYASGEFVALIDSDNILPDDNWLSSMIFPLIENPEIVGSEPWEYTWRAEDGFITRYCALIGMNDPICMFLGNYDRLNVLYDNWTKIPHTEVDKKNYVIAEFDQKNGLPTIGANGTVFKRDFLVDNSSGDYLFDIDILATYLAKNEQIKFIKVKNGIIHTFCESDISKFSRKQKRRVKDYIYHKSRNDRSYQWTSDSLISQRNLGLIKFVLYCVTVIPLVLQSVLGYFKKPDKAWAFHPLACEITFYQYVTGFIGGIFKQEQVNRNNWKQ